MPELRIDRVDDALRHAPLVAASVRLVGRAQHVGALASLPGGRTLDRSLLQETLRALAAAGAGGDLTPALAAARAPADLLAVVQDADVQLERSPVPDLTRPVALEVLGAGLLTVLLDVDPADLAATPPTASGVVKDAVTVGVVAGRLHQVALTAADLAGAYDDEGTRRWYARPRRALDGASPVRVLAGGFDPGGDAARQVRGMAAALTRLGAT